MLRDLRAQMELLGLPDLPDRPAPLARTVLQDPQALRERPGPPASGLQAKLALRVLPVILGRLDQSVLLVQREPLAIPVLPGLPDLPAQPALPERLVLRGLPALPGLPAQPALPAPPERMELQGLREPPASQEPRELREPPVTLEPLALRELPGLPDLREQRA